MCHDDGDMLTSGSGCVESTGALLELLRRQNGQDLVTNYLDVGVMWLGQLTYSGQLGNSDVPHRTRREKKDAQVFDGWQRQSGMSEWIHNSYIMENLLIL